MSYLQNITLLSNLVLAEACDALASELEIYVQYCIVRRIYLETTVVSNYFRYFAKYVVVRKRDPW